MLSVFPVICSVDLATSRDFYVALFELEVVFESGWYTELRSASNPANRVALVSSGHPSVPEPFTHQSPAGVLITIEVEDAAAVHERAATDLALSPVLSLRDEDFGQRHFMVTDPDGLLVDVVEPIPPSRDFLVEVAAWRRARR